MTHNTIRRLNGRIYIAGHAGLVGSAFIRRWAARPGVELLTATRQELDLTDGPAVTRWLARARPELVVMAAGRVGGIHANASQPAAFGYDNLMIEANLIHGAWKAGAKRVLNFGSACMYPKLCPQPMRPEQLMTGPLEPTSQPYAIAKLAGWMLAEAYRAQYGLDATTVIPCALYGPGDNLDPAESHVLCALIRKCWEARQRGQDSVTLWGTGEAKREFLYIDDLAEACERLLETEPLPAVVNIGSQQPIAIRELAELIAHTVGYRGRIEWDASRPDGAPEKTLDSQPMRALGWTPRTALHEGLERTVEWFTDCRNLSSVTCDTQLMEGTVSDK